MSEKRGETSYDADKPNIGSKRLLGELTQKKIAYYLSKNKISEADLYAVVKDFFGELLDIHSEYTMTELLVEINRTYFEQPVKDKLEGLIKKIQIIEYKSGAFTEEEIKKMFNEFSSIVSETLRIKSSSEKKDVKSIFTTLFTHKTSKKEQETPKQEEPELTAEEIMDRLEGITSKRKEEKPEEKEEETPPVPESSEEEALQRAVNSLDAEEILPAEEVDESWTQVDETPSIQVSTDDWTEEVKELKKPKKTEKKGKTEKKAKKQDKPDKKALRKLITSAKRSRKKETLKKKYHQINEIYEKLSNEEKHEFFDDVHKLYEKTKKSKK